MRIRDWSSDVCSSDLLVPSSGVAQGERMVTPNQFQGTLLLGTTRVPESSDPCNPSGSGWIMAIDPFTGRGPGSVFFDLQCSLLGLSLGLIGMYLGLVGRHTFGCG